MLENVIRVGVKNKDKNDLVEFFTLPIYWRSSIAVEDSLNSLVEHSKYVKKFNTLKNETDKNKLISEIKNKEWFYSGVSHCEEQSVLSGEKLNLKQYKEEIKNLSLNVNQHEWIDHLFLKRDTGERFIIHAFWDQGDLSLHNVKVLTK